MVDPLAADLDLTDRRVLVVEDEYFIADEISCTLERCQAKVIGPAASIPKARELIDQERPDCVVLDLNLTGELTFGFAGELADRGLPLVFTTGYDAAVIPSRFDGVALLEKPLDVDRLVEAVVRECARAAR
jgi:DNA-binding NtrC family response regulator